MKNLPIEVLRTFVTVAELGSFTQAGDLLGRSQPAISIQIKRLENMSHTPLFIRRGHQLTLSNAGKVFFNYARQILNLNDDAIAQLEQHSIIGKVHFGIPSEFASALLPKIVGRFSQSYPSVSLQVTCDLSQNLIAQRKQKNYDLILVTHNDALHKSSTQLIADDLVWVSSAEYEINHHDVIPLIVAPEPCKYRQRCIQILKEKKQAWRIVYTNPDLNGIQAAISEGLGVTVLAKTTVPSGLNILQDSDKLPHLGKVFISLIYDEEKTDAAVKLLVDYVIMSLSKLSM